MLFNGFSFEFLLPFASGFFTFLGFSLASFVLWRNLKDDYPEDEILTFTIWTVLLGLLLGRIFYVAEHFPEFNFSFLKWVFWTRFPGFSLPGGFIGGVLFCFWWSKKKNWDRWVLLDSVASAWLTALIFGSIGSFLANREPVILYRLAWVGLVALIFVFLLHNFRKFIWYKSGKPGFIACSSTSLYFVGIAALDFFIRFGLYLDTLLALLITFLGLVFLYSRSERKIKEDIRGVGQILSSRKN